MTQTPIPGLGLPANFHRTMSALVRELEDLGWTGRLSTPGHAIMRAPDGVTTCSITPKLGSPRHLANNRAKIDRWKREQEAQAVRATELIQTGIELPAERVTVTVPVPVDTPDTAVTCEDCGRSFAALQALSVHRVRVHVRVPCRVCLEPFSPGNLDRHQATHLRELGDPVDTLAELHRLRREVTEWQGLAEEAEQRATALRDASQRAAAILLDL